jgi:hypothetical protein
MNKEINIEGFKAENGFCGLRNKITGEQLTSPLYSKITLDDECLCIGDSWYEDTLCLMRTNIENLYIMIKYYDDGCETFCTLLDGQQGKKISNSYNFISTQFVCGLCRVVGGEKDGYIDVTGKQVIKLEKYFYENNFNPNWYYQAPYELMYDDLEYSSYICDFTKDGLARIHFKYLKYRELSIYGYINTRGEIAITPQYDYAEDFINGKAKVMLGGETFYRQRSKNGERDEAALEDEFASDRKNT